jgi:hypothetical protein
VFPLCSIDYIEKSGDYERVIDLSDNNSIGSVSININLFSEIRSASIEFLIKTTDTSKGFWLNSSLSKVFNGFSLSVVSNSRYFILMEVAMKKSWMLKTINGTK